MACDSVGRTARFAILGLLVWVPLAAAAVPTCAATKDPAEYALELLRSCPPSLSDRRQQHWMDGLDLLRAVHLDQVLAVVNGSGPVSCRGLAIVSAGAIAAQDQNVTRRVVLAVTPYLSHPDLWQAAIQAIVPIGAAANDVLVPLLDTADEMTWKGLVVILQNINHSRLPEQSDLRSPRVPDNAAGRAEVSASWRRWWQNAKAQGGRQ